MDHESPDCPFVVITLPVLACIRWHLIFLFTHKVSGLIYIAALIGD